MITTAVVYWLMVNQSSSTYRSSGKNTNLRRESVAFARVSFQYMLSVNFTYVFHYSGAL